jgi:hypothetical protein
VNAPCNADGDLCTTDQCDGAGACVFVSNVTCQAASPPCEGGEVCNPGTGLCDAQPDAPVSTPCEMEGDLCTVDACDGRCVCVELDRSMSGCQPAVRRGVQLTYGCVRAQPDAMLSAVRSRRGSRTTDLRRRGSCVFLSPVTCQAATRRARPARCAIRGRGPVTRCSTRR